MTITPGDLDVVIRRAKLHPPQGGHGVVARPRLTSRLDGSLHLPLTLISAPAGFGKTTLLLEWAASQAVPLAWLTLDAGDRNHARLALHMVAALESLVPSVGAPVRDLLRRPQPAPATELGLQLADALFALSRDIVLIVDDYHLAASAEVDRFLSGLFQTPPPLLHLMLVTRRDPALPLARTRLRGAVHELRAADLRFSDDEAQALLIMARQTTPSPDLVAALQAQTGGWIAGLRLATLALPAVEDLTRITDVVMGDQHLMAFLLEEVLATQPEVVQQFLLRTALVDRLAPSLADALLEVPPGGSQLLLDLLVRESLFLEPTDDGAWLRYHPLFHGLLRHQLESRLPPHAIVDLHARASAWYAGEGDLDRAIFHGLRAGDVTGVADLVERHVQPALDREDWPVVDTWLRLLPESVIQQRPALLLAQAWVSHFSGRAAPIRAMFATLNGLLSTPDLDQPVITALAAERDALTIGALLTLDQDPEDAVAFARRVVAQVPAHHRLAAGLATFGLGCALQAAGRTDEALRWLTMMAEQDEAQIDAGSIRALGGLMFVHRQAGNLTGCANVAQHLLALAERHRLPVATAWGHWMLGWLAYERVELEIAREHFSAIVVDYQRVHLHSVCEALCGLALIAHVQQIPVEAASMVNRLLEILLDGNALEYLPVLRGFEARLALLRDEPQQAIDWLRMDDGTALDRMSLDAFEHAGLTRIKVLLAEGIPESLAQAEHHLAAFQTLAERQNHHAHRIELLALAALVLAAQGDVEAALGQLAHSVALAAPAGVVRTFVDLGPQLPPLLHTLTTREPGSPYLQRLLDVCAADPTVAPDLAHGSGTWFSAPPLDRLTQRERDVLACLARHLSYQEIGDALFISPQTVKGHVAKVYDKLGATSRREALAIAQSLGWTPPPSS